MHKRSISDDWKLTNLEEENFTDRVGGGDQECRFSGLQSLGICVLSIVSTVILWLPYLILLIHVHDFSLMCSTCNACFFSL